MLIEWMPALPEGIFWSTFVGQVADRSITPGSQLILLELAVDPGIFEFVSARDSVRAALSPLTVVIEYTDIYETSMTPCRRELSWFARHTVDREGGGAQ